VQTASFRRHETTLKRVNAIQIVVIEDCDNDAELTMEALRRCHVSNPIIRMRDGDEALTFLMNEHMGRRRHLPRRLIVLDLKMPNAGGIEVLKKIRDNPSTKSLPVVMLTGSRDVSDRIESESLGVDMFFIKPLTDDAVARMVDYAESFWKTAAI